MQFPFTVGARRLENLLSGNLHSSSLPYVQIDTNLPLETGTTLSGQTIRTAEELNPVAPIVTAGVSSRCGIFLSMQ